MGTTTTMALKDDAGACELEHIADEKTGAAESAAPVFCACEAQMIIAPEVSI